MAHPQTHPLSSGLRRPKQVCKLFKVKDPSMVIPLEAHERNLCGIPATWGRCRPGWNQTCPVYGFWDRPLHHMEHFVGQRLEPSEIVDVYLTNWRRLAVPFGRATDHILECVFMGGLPDDVSQLLWINWESTSCWPWPKRFWKTQNWLQQLQEQPRHCLRGNILQVIPPCQGHEKAQNATDVVVLTITPG